MCAHGCDTTHIVIGLELIWNLTDNFNEQNFNVFMSPNLQRSMAHRSYGPWHASDCSDYCSSETREQEYRNRKKSFRSYSSNIYLYIFNTNIPNNLTSNDYPVAIGYNVKYSNGRMLTVFIYIKLNSLICCFLGLFIDLINLAIYSSFYSDNAVLGSVYNLKI